MPLAKLLVALIGGKVANVIGKDNINIQGVSNSKITINDISELENKLNEFFKNSKRPLYFIIFSDSTENPQDWKPFNGRSILELIQTCMNNFTNVNSVLWFIDSSQPIDENTGDDLKEIKDQSIILFDTSSEYCQLFKEIFDHFEIGGCIGIPDKKNIKLKTLFNVRTDESKMNRRKKTYKYALKNIKSDFDILEAINNIISVYMDGYQFASASITPTDESQIKPNNLMNLNL